MKPMPYVLLALGVAVVIAASPLRAAPPAPETGAELSWKVDYDAEGRTAAITDPASRTTRFAYEHDGEMRLRRVVRTGPDGATVTRDLDERGRLVAMRDGAGAVVYGYDDLGRLNRVAREGAPTILYTHDTTDRIKTLSVGDFYRIEYHYDFLGRMESIDTPAGLVRYDYLTGEGKIVRHLPNGVATVWQHAPDGTLEKIAHLLQADPKGTCHSTLSEYGYAYRPDGLIEAVAERSSAGETQRTYQYDTVGRLVRAKGAPRPQYVYGYDQVGNRTQTLSTLQAKRNFGYDWAGRLTDIEGTATAHDAAGNLTALTLGGKTWRYRFDADNRLAEVLGGKASYRYDGDGNLIERIAGKDKTRFIPDPLSDYWRPLVMEDKGDQRTLVIWDGSTPLMTIREGKPEYLLHDHLSSVRLVVNSRGEITQRIGYDPFGMMEDPAAAEEFAPRFAGLFWDPVASVYLTRGRTYSSQLGRFFQIDPKARIPLGSQKDLSLYSYCGSDPINFGDQDGEEPTFLSDGNARARTPFQILHNSIITYLSIGPGSTIHAGRQDETVINQILDNAWDMAPLKLGQYHGSHSEKEEIAYSPARAAWKQIKYWRDHPAEYMKQYPGGNVPTASEWQAAEWRALVRQYIVTGVVADDNRSPFQVRARPGLDAATYMLTKHLPGWEGFHRLAERFHIPPGMVPRLMGPVVQWKGQWQEHSGETGRHARIGVQEGLKDYFALERAPDINLQRLKKSRALADVIMEKIEAARDAIKKHDISGGDWRVAGPVGRASPAAYAALREYCLLSPTSARPVGGVHLGGAGQLQDVKRFRKPLDSYYWLAPPPPPPPPGPNSQRNSYGTDRYDLPGRRTAVRLSDYFWGGPSSVGGIYLGGTGQALNGVGLLDGIALDANNNLILLDKGGQQIGLPPLRLDDVVTVFRSVYLYGEAPSVSIDLNPDDPEGSAMFIRHGEATEGTYVGWVLFQADRLMKGYTLGADNDTAKDIKTGVPGYRQVLDTLFFGGEMPKKGQKGGHWERFWIVPAETSRFAGDLQALTLFDVPLKVKTQSMKWENGKLVDNASGKSSPGATAFTDWFTKHYEEIAGERFLLPPPESGMTKPVPVFTELRRIALMTAIAEKLRDQGVPLPFWMRDYQVTPVPFERSTPALEVTKSKGQVVARVFGGVNLSVEDKSVHDFHPRSDLSGLGSPEREAVREGLARAASLEGAVREEMKSVEPLEIRKLDRAGVGYQAVALPGAQTQALAPARLDEVDLSVPIAGGIAIELVRRYNSFFSPDGPWGKGWALDLPRLEEMRVPIRREGDSVSYQNAYESITPLNSGYTRFSRIEPVPALNDSWLLVPDAPISGEPSEFYGLADAQPAFLSGPTHKLIRKDGGAWHFDKAGNLVATEAGGMRVVYERDSNGRLARILGLLGRQPVAFIDLTYNASGLLESASGRSGAEDSQASVVRYSYDGSGRLASVASASGRLGYRYQGAWVTAVTFAPDAAPGRVENDPPIRTFEYDARGRLLREVAADGAATDYRIASESNGSSLSATPAGSTTAAETIRYDGAFRPVEARYADGSGAAWHYPDQGGTILDISNDDGTAVARVTESADRRHRTVAMDGGPQLASEHDEGGRLTSLAQNGRTLLQQAWSADGRLRKASTESQAEHYEYDAEGLVSRVVLTPPEAGERFANWQATRLDPFGRPVEVTDYRGMHLAMSYDRSGELKGAVTKQEGKSFGVEIARDAAGRVERIASPSGSQHCSYDENGFLEALKEEKKGATAGAEWRSGLLRKVKQFDGGDLSLRYFEDEDRAGLLLSVTTPNDLTLTYEYDPENRLAEVAIGHRSRMRLDYDADGRLAGWRYQSAPR